MSGSTTQQTTQNTSSATQPWTAAQPQLMSILSQLGNANLGPTPGQTSASNLLSAEAGTVPSFGAAGTAAVNNLFNSNTTPQQGMLGDAWNTLQTYLSPNYTNPMTAPGIGDALTALNQNITGQINGQFAAAGRDMSPDNSKALAAGLAQGEGGLLANEFNTLSTNQLGAVSGANNTAADITAQQEVPLTNAVTGMEAAGSLPSLISAPGAAQMGAATTAAGLPTINLPQIEGLTVPIAGLGSETQSTSTGTTTTTAPLAQTLLSGGLLGASLMGQLGLGSSVASGLSSLGSGISSFLNPASAAFIFSDERVKEGVKPVGLLFDHTPVFSYRYKGDPKRTTRIGLIAQDVERRRPDAVRQFRGVKAVDYGKATERARSIGMLGDMFDRMAA